MDKVRKASMSLKGWNGIVFDKRIGEYVLTAPKTTTERVADLRRRRSDAGLVRMELYAHPDDHAAIKVAAQKLAKKRAAGPKVRTK